MLKRSKAGLAAAIFVPSVTSIALIQLTNASATGNVPHLSGTALWFLAWVSLALVSVILGKAMQLAAASVGGVLVLGLGLGAILKPSGAPPELAAVLAVTLSFVVMVAAVSCFRNSTTNGGRALASSFWVLAACIVAGATWNCVFCGCSPRCRIYPHLAKASASASASCAVSPNPSLRRTLPGVRPGSAAELIFR
jgi:hypothetical protein